MKFRKRYSKGTVFMAMLQGVIIGVAAVALIGFILIWSNGKQAVEEPKTNEEELPITGPAPINTETPAPLAQESVQLFARQHGVFTTSTSAITFIAEVSSLTSAAIIKADGQYYVWTSVGLTEAEIMDSESEGTFRKRLVVDTSACVAMGAGKLHDVLSTNEISKIKTLEVEKEREDTSEFDKNITAITAFSNDMRVIRLHLLSYYSSEKECVKITF